MILNYELQEKKLNLGVAYTDADTTNGFTSKLSK